MYLNLLGWLKFISQPFFSLKKGLDAEAFFQEKIAYSLLLIAPFKLSHSGLRNLNVQRSVLPVTDLTPTS